MTKPNAIAATWQEDGKTLTQAYVDETIYLQSIESAMHMKSMYDQARKDIEELRNISRGLVNDKGNRKLFTIECRYGLADPDTSEL